MPDPVGHFSGDDVGPLFIAGLPSGSVRNQITQKWFPRKVVVLVVPLWFQDVFGVIIGENVKMARFSK